MLHIFSFSYACIFITLLDIFFLKAPKENLTQFKAFFWQLKEMGLKLKPSKYEFFKRSLTYLGCKIVEKGIETDD